MHLPDRVAVLVNRPEESNTALGSEAVRGVMLAAEAAERALRAAGCGTQVISCGKTPSGLIEQLGASKAQVVVNLAEEAWGNDRFEPVVAYLLAVAGVPFTGSPPEALVVARHKGRARMLASAAGIRVPKGEVIGRAPEEPLRRSHDVIVKPACHDGSIGIHPSSVVVAGDDIAPVVRACGGRVGGPVLVEQFIEGREINATLVERAAGDWLIIPSEIDFSAMPAGRPHIVSYEAKWHAGSTEDRGTSVHPDVELGPQILEQVTQTARALVSGFGLRGYARYDARLDAEGRLYLVDINPNPDISPGAGVIRALARRGIEHAQFICEQVALAWERGITEFA